MGQSQSHHVFYKQQPDLNLPEHPIKVTKLTRDLTGTSIVPLIAKFNKQCIHLQYMIQDGLQGGSRTLHNPSWRHGNHWYFFEALQQCTGTFIAKKTIKPLVQRMYSLQDLNYEQLATRYGIKINRNEAFTQLQQEKRVIPVRENLIYCGEPEVIMSLRDDDDKDFV